MKLIAGALAEWPLPLIATVVFLALLAARELGALAHRRLAGENGSDGDSGDEGFILSGALGLLALLIGFTFSLALDRYETRRELVVAEANAIGTAATRFRLLDTPDSTRMVRLLSRYAKTRLAYGLAVHEAKPPLAAASRAQRAAIESTAVELARPLRATALAPSLIAAVNDVLDRGADRDAAQAARLPVAVLVVLLVYTLVSSAVLGYVLAGGRSAHRVATAVLMLLLTLAIAIILDLDRPRSGTIQVSQQPMAELVRDLER